MKKLLRKHKKLALFCLVVITWISSVWAWNLSASLRGRLVARFDIARGHFEILGYGSPSWDEPVYKRLLRERYGIGFRRVADCLVDRELMEYVDAYDAAVVSAAKLKFGRDVVKESWEDAVQITKQSTAGSGLSPTKTQLR